MKKKKILYLFSDTGGGHRSAANAIISAVKTIKKRPLEQKMVDIFDLAHPLSRFMSKMYGPFVNYTPFLWKFLYKTTNTGEQIKQLEKVAYPFLLEPYKKLIKKEKPDMIVSVHPLMNHMTIKVLQDLKLKIPFVVVVTDPVSYHSTWITPLTDLIIVATEEAKKLAIKYGAAADKIQVLGLPIDLRFAESTHSRLTSKKKKENFVVLMMGGGEGTGGMQSIIKSINRANLNIRLIVIAGRNKGLEKTLKKNRYKYPVPMEVYGFTTEVPKIMGQADLLISKAGPGSIAEALAMRLPMIITSFIPGQEEGNVALVKKRNLGRITLNPNDVPQSIKEIMNQKEYQCIQKNIDKIRRPDASLKIAKSILKYL